MTRDPSCIFCQIASGHAPAAMVAEDNLALAFMDINPVHPGHVLIIPRCHAVNLFDLGNEDLLATAALTKRVAYAVQAALTPDGINLVQSNGPGAAQSVMHFHIHVLPRHFGDNLLLNWPLIPGTMESIKQVASQIRDAC